MRAPPSFPKTQCTKGMRPSPPPPPPPPSPGHGKAYLKLGPRMGRRGGGAWRHRFAQGCQEGCGTRHTWRVPTLDSTTQYRRKQARVLRGSLASIPGRVAIIAAATACAPASCTMQNTLNLQNYTGCGRLADITIMRRMFLTCCLPLQAGLAKAHPCD